MWPLILGAAGAGASVLGNLFADEVMPTNLNAANTEAFRELLNKMLADSESDLSKSLQQMGFTQSQISQLAAKQGQITEQMGQLEAPGADDWFASFTQKYVPAYQQIAQQTAEMATRDESAQTRADLLSSQGVTRAMDQFAGGAYSGAAAEAATQAAIAPQLEYLQSVDQMFGNVLSQTFNQQAATGQGLAFQGSQNEFLNNLQKLTSQLGGVQGQAGSLGTILQSQLGQAQLGQQGVSNALGQLGTLNQPVYATPSYEENWLSTLGQALGLGGNLLGSYQANQQNQQLINLLTQTQGV